MTRTRFISRRSLHERLRALSLCLLASCACLVQSVPSAVAQQTGGGLAPKLSTKRLSAQDDAFLEDLSRRAFLYFQDHADLNTGLVLDRARTDGAAHDAKHPSHNIASSAATGFGLTALC
ncbi:MAG TPA: hypothetical protein VF766_06045, partial [Pyrinomonadaceae bacterium]